MSSPCYCQSLRAAARRIAAAYDDALAPSGVNTAQYSLLRTIERAGPIALTALGRRVELDRSTIGRNVRVLERMGLVALGRGDDHREATATLTEAGRDAIAKAAPLWDAAQAALEARMGAASAQDLRKTLNAL